MSAKRSPITHSSTSSQFIHIKNVHKYYGHNESRVHALRGIDLDIKVGQFAVICGPSGSGKTTLLNCIGALDAIDEGSLEIDSIQVHRLSPSELADLRRKHLGFVFQSHNLIAVMNAWENASLSLSLNGINKSEAKDRAFEVLRLVGLQGMEDRKPDQLSGGQQQRVAIARAIAHHPKLVIADEPTASLDGKTAESLLDLMQELNEVHATTFVFSTHDPRIMKRAKSLFKMEDGRLKLDS